jgi:hypothetical protein
VLIEKAGEVSIFFADVESLTLEAPFIEGDWSPVMKKALAFNQPGQRFAKAPVPVLHGCDDNVVPPTASKRTVARGLPAARSRGRDMKGTSTAAWLPQREARSWSGPGSGWVERTSP